MYIQHISCGWVVRFLVSGRAFDVRFSSFLSIYLTVLWCYADPILPALPLPKLTCSNSEHVSGTLVICVSTSICTCLFSPLDAWLCLAYDLHLSVTNCPQRRGSLTEFFLPRFLTISLNEFYWVFLVFLEGLGWLRGSSMDICEALCDIACKTGYTNLIWSWLQVQIPLVPYVTIYKISVSTELLLLKWRLVYEWRSLEIYIKIFPLMVEKQLSNADSVCVGVCDINVL